MSQIISAIPANALLPVAGALVGWVGHMFWLRAERANVTAGLTRIRRFQAENDAWLDGHKARFALTADPDVTGEVLHVEHATGEHQLPALSHVDELIAASSLGTPDAVQLRESVDDEVARRIVERSKEFGVWLADANAAAEDHVAERLDVPAELAKLKQRAAEADRACCDGHNVEPCDPHAGYVLPCCGDCPDWPRFIALSDEPEHDDEDAPADDTDRPGLHLVLLAVPVALWDRAREWWRSLWAKPEPYRGRHWVAGTQHTGQYPIVPAQREAAE